MDVFVERSREAIAIAEGISVDVLCQNVAQINYDKYLDEKIRPYCAKYEIHMF